MKGKRGIEEIRGYCSQCSCWCPTVSIVRDGVFVEVRPDTEHPLGHSLCPKGLAGPELVYNEQKNALELYWRKLVLCILLLINQTKCLVVSSNGLLLHEH